MNRGTKINTLHSLKFFLGILLFAGLFSLCFLLVKETFPLKTANHALSTVVELDENILPEITPDQYQKTVATHTKQDLGLLYYRDPNYRNYVHWFYSHITGNEDISSIILEFADKNNVSVSLAFALAYTESRYRSRAVNYNTNLSIDRGLFQLNDKSFPHLNEEDFFDPKTSAQYGLSYLRKCLDSAGNEIAALAMYNAGASKVKKGSTPHKTLNYIAQISNYRDGLDTLFDTEVIGKLKEQNMQPQTTLAAAAAPIESLQFINFKK